MVIHGILFDLGNSLVSYYQLIEAFMGPIFDVARLDAETIPLLRALRDQGIKTGILSNTSWGCPSALWYAELDSHGLSENIDLALFCVGVGWRKPKPAIFETALKKLGLKPQHTLFVGDDPRWDVEGAMNAGLRPVLLDKGIGDADMDVLSVKSLQEILSLIDDINAPDNGHQT